MGMNRREFVKAGALAGAGLAGSVGMVVKDRVSKPKHDPTGPGTVRHLTVLNNIKPRHDEDVLIRMQRDLKRAMAKPVEQRRWVMVIDQRKCIGCHACTIGCVAENKLPPGVVYRPVITEERGEFPNVSLKFTPRPCMQCDAPPCVPVCPVKATWKRPDGIVTIDYDKCIGCRYCLTACPYGARTSDFGLHYTDADGGKQAESPATLGEGAAAWEHKPNHEYAKHWDRENHNSPVGNARKCHFCLHRLEKGELPMCTTTCIGRATYFGDHNDPDSLVTELIAKNNVHTLLPHKGTKPRVFYIA
ncbi:MAG: 4Fe-4S dicluster domain-containing protein [Phycisphaeraceae bacterium]